MGKMKELYQEVYEILENELGREPSYDECMTYIQNNDKRLIEEMKKELANVG